jgi:hypothetical protein
MGLARYRVFAQLSRTYGLYDINSDEGELTMLDLDLSGPNPRCEIVTTSVVPHGHPSQPPVPTTNNALTMNLRESC